jgi:flagellar biosynthesis protein FliQ
MKDGALKTTLAGLAAGFVGNGVLGALFSSPPIQTILYNPRWQSQLFMEVTPKRNIPVSVAGLVVLSVIHSWLFRVLKTAIPGKSWKSKGLFWGLTIWLMYWLSQEWFIYHTLLGEPLLLNILELSILLTGSLVEGLIIAFFLARNAGKEIELIYAPN